MKKRWSISLLWKMLIWLVLHLSLLSAIVFFILFWQLRVGLDSLLRGPAGDRLRAGGEMAAGQLRDTPPSRWPEVMRSFSNRYGVTCDIWMPHGDWVSRQWKSVPREMMDRLQVERTGRLRAGQGPRFQGGGDGPLPEDGGEPAIRNRRRAGGPPPWSENASEPPPPPADPEPNTTLALRPVQPLFMVNGPDGKGFWAAVHLPLPGRRPDHVTWVIRSDTWTANGLYFDTKPWLTVGLAILGFSILFWLPFALGLTRHIKKLKAATDRIAEGRFDINIPDTRRDELGALGHAITSMSTRLDQLVSGQKRFLGDVAHELCSPLARMRTGLGILEERLPAGEKSRLLDIEAEAAELAELIDEVLAFSRSSAGVGQARQTPVVLIEIIETAIRRECAHLQCDIDVDSRLRVMADPKLLTRALSNILRNVVRHAGSSAHVRISGFTIDQGIRLTASDNGPGVPEDEIARLFEPFYRPDLARARETGGTGLGLTIVKSCVEACGGSVRAMNAPEGGFRVEMDFQQADD